MYETKLRKHEREYHMDADDIRKLVRQEIFNAMFGFVDSLMTRMLFGFTAGGAAVLGTVLIAAFVNSPGLIEEPIRSFAINMAWLIGAGAFLTAFIFYKRRE